MTGIACGSRGYVIWRRKRCARCVGTVMAGRTDRALGGGGVIFGTQERSKHTRGGVLVARFTGGGIRGDMRRNRHAPGFDAVMTSYTSSWSRRVVVGDVY